MNEPRDSGERWFPDSMPLPAASAETLAWWQAAAEHRLMVQRCDECGRYRHPPSPRCPTCHSVEASLVEHDGSGTIYTCTRVHQPFLTGLDLPYVIAVIDLHGLEADHIRLVTNIVDAEPSEVRIGLPVELVWEDMGPDLALPRARLAPTDSATASASANRESLPSDTAHVDTQFPEGDGSEDVA